MALVSAWLDPVRERRDRLLANRRFQRWAAAFPLTRPIARRRARALFDLCAGFVYSQVLTAFVRLGLPALLLGAPQTVAALARRLDVPEEAMRRLLDAAAALRLAEPRGDDRYGLGDLGAALAGQPAVAAMVEHHALLYADLRDPLALLRGAAGETALSRYWPYATRGAGHTGDAADVAPYTALMAASQPLVADEILDAYPLRRHRCLLDVGGGDGTFAVEAARRAPDLAVRLFDLPAVAQKATARFAAAGLAGRAQAVGGDFHRDALPAGADVATLVRVVHDHDDAVARALLRAVHRALPPGGTLVVAEPMAGVAGAEPVGDAYFGFYLLAMGSGRPRAAEALGALISSAGFAKPRAVATASPWQTGVLVARRL